jgi:hypothetical protein
MDILNLFAMKVKISRLYFYFQIQPHCHTIWPDHYSTCPSHVYTPDIWFHWSVVDIIPTLDITQYWKLFTTADPIRYINVTTDELKIKTVHTCWNNMKSLMILNILWITGELRKIITHWGKLVANMFDKEMEEYIDH